MTERPEPDEDGVVDLTDVEPDPVALEHSEQRLDNSAGGDA